MDWRAKVELFEEIRREYEFGVGTIAGVARKVKVHRRMVREAIANEESMKISASLLVVAMACSLLAARGRDANPLVLVQTIALPEVQGGLNHMSVDAGRQRLFASAPSDGKLEIVDLRSGKLWRTLNSERPAAARFAAEFNQLYVSSGRYLYIYDGSSFGLIARLDLGSRLDEIAYDASAKELYVGCMTTGETGIAVIAVPQAKLLQRISLSASPQGIVVDHEAGRLFASLPDASLVAVVGRARHESLASWSVTGASDNVPLALDERGHRLFVACRTPPEMVVLDIQSGRVIARVPCVGDADDAWYDAATRRIYVSGGEGLISVVEQQDAEHYRLLGNVTTAEGAATSVFSNELKSLYVGAPRRGRSPAEILVFKPAEKWSIRTAH